MKTLVVKLYNDMILSIKRGRSKNGLSNAKPLFLLSVIECISMGQLNENQIRCEDENLKRTYYALAKYYKENPAPFHVPFYHIATSGFFHLTWNVENRPKYVGNTPSHKYLKDYLRYAKFDDDLWELLQNAENQIYLKKNIVNRFLIKQ